MKQVLVKKGLAIVAEVPVPTLTDQDILVEVYYSLISTGTEMAKVQDSEASLIQKALSNPQNIDKVLQMLKQKGLSRTLKTVKSKDDVELVTGYSCSGKVIGVGKGISDIKVGDFVACAGAGKANHAEYVSVPKNFVVKIPEGCSLEYGASVTIGAIALQGIRRADIRLGESVAVIGLGLIGQITVQLLLASGCRVIGIDIDQARIDLALSMGMDFGLNPTEEDMETRIRNLTSGFGTDATMITADSKENAIIQEAMEITRKKGKVIVVGAVGLGLQRKPFYEKEIDLLISCSYGPGRYDESYEEKGIDYPYAFVRWTENRNMQAFLRLIADKKIDFAHLVQARYPIESASEAFSALKNTQKRPLAVLLTYKKSQDDEKKSLTFSVGEVSKSIQGRIRVGVIGCGNFATEMHLPNLHALHKQFSVDMLSDCDGAKLRMISKQFNVPHITTDYQEIMKDPNIDMVLLCTRHNLHAKMVIEAISSGKAVFVEKPLATTEDDLNGIKETVDTYRDTTRLMVGFNRRFSPAAKKAKEILLKRVNPAIILYRVNAGYIPLNHWVHTEEGGGRIIGEACHMLDLFRYLIGCPVAEVSLSAISSSTSYISANDNIITTIKYQDGSLCGLLYSSLGTKEVEKETVEILCDNKVMAIHDYQSLDIKGSKEKGWSGKREDKGHLNELKEWYQYLKGDAVPPIPFDEMIETTELSFLLNKIEKYGDVCDTKN